MKKGIHPNYRPVVFTDVSGDFSILTRSTIETSDTTTWEDGKEYPLYKIDISSASHRFTQVSRKYLIQKEELKNSRRNLEVLTLADLKNKISTCLYEAGEMFILHFTGFFMGKMQFLGNH